MLWDRSDNLILQCFDVCKVLVTVYILCYHWTLYYSPPVSNSLIFDPVPVFQKCNFLSWVPPPLPRMPTACGLQAIALTAAVCSWNRWRAIDAVWWPVGYVGSILELRDFRTSQTKSLLSFPPLASKEDWRPLNFKPHTSCLIRRENSMSSLRQYDPYYELVTIKLLEGTLGEPGVTQPNRAILRAGSKNISAPW